MNNIGLALFLTFLVYLSINISKSFYRFRVFLNIKKSVLIYTAIFFSDQTRETFNQEEYIAFIMQELKKKKLQKWVKKIDVMWKSQFQMLIKFRIKYSDVISHEFSFPMNINDFRNLKEDNRREK